MATDATASVSLSARIPNVSQFTDLLGELKAKVGAAKVPEIPVARIQGLSDRFSFSIPDTSSWPSYIPKDATAVLDRLPDAAGLAKPLAEPLARVQAILAFPIADEMKRIEDAIVGLTPASLATPDAYLRGLIDPLATLAGFLEQSELPKLVGSIAAFAGAENADRFPRDAAAAISSFETLLRDRVASVILAVTGLASASTTVMRTERLVGVIGAGFSWEATEARYQAVLRAYGEGGDSLAAALASVDVSNAERVTAIRTRLTDARAAFADFQLSLVRDLALTEAGTAILDTDALLQSLKATAGALGALQTSQIKAAGARVQKAAADLTSGFKVDPALTPEALRKMIADGFEHARTAVGEINPAAIKKVLEDVLNVIQTPFKALQELKHAVETLTRTAMAELKQALAAIDLSPLQRGADQFLDGLGEQLQELEKLSAEVHEAIEGALKAAAAVLDELRQTVLDPENGLKKQIQTVFDSVFSLLDGLNIQATIDAVSGVLQPISVELGKIEFAPVFDAAADAIDTVNDVLRTVAPLLVTDALKEKLGDATSFLRKIDFDEIASALNDAFDEILAAVDEDALGQVTIEYKKVIDAIDKFDPSPALEAVQKEAFDPVIAELEKVNPTELLKPLVDAYQGATDELRTFSPAENLAFATKFFDDLLARFHELSPDKLLEPVEAALNDVKAQIDSLLQVDDALDVMNQVTGLLKPALESVVVGPVLDQMTGGFKILRADLVSIDVSDVVAPLTAALGAALARAGALVDGTGIVDALMAVANQGASVEERLRLLPGRLAATAADLAKLDPAAMLTTLRARHGELKTAMNVQASGSTLSLELSLDVAALDPVPVLSALAAKTARVMTAFRQKTDDLTKTVAALEPDLRPIGDVRDALASFLAAFETIRAAVTNPLRTVLGEGSPKELLGRFLDQADPETWRPNLEAVLTALHAKVTEILSDVVLNPIAEAAGSLKSITGLLDVSTLIQPVVDVFREIEETINQLNPAPLVQALDERFKQVLQALENLNPAPFVAEIQKLYADDLIGVLKAISPAELLLPPLRELFDRIKGLLVSLDVEVLFKPILERLRALKVQLVDGLTRTGAGYNQMLDTLDSAGGASASVSVSVDA